MLNTVAAIPLVFVAILEVFVSVWDCKLDVDVAGAEATCSQNTFVKESSSLATTTCELTVGTGQTPSTADRAIGETSKVVLESNLAGMRTLISPVLAFEYETIAR